MVVFSVSQVEVKIFHRLPKQMDGSLLRNKITIDLRFTTRAALSIVSALTCVCYQTFIQMKSYWVTTFSHLVLLQKCQRVLNPDLILKVALYPWKEVLVKF